MEISFQGQSMSSDASSSVSDETVCHAVPEKRDIVVKLNETEMAAVDGWRRAHGVESLSDAIRELARLGLLSEISGAYDLVASIRDSTD